MDEVKADELALSLGGDAQQDEEGRWIVVIKRSDGRIVVATDSSIDEFADWDDYKVGHCYASIALV